MKKQLMDILACPICKQHPLNLEIFQEENNEIKEGLLSCGQCKRNYVIQNFVPTMLPDEYRNKAEEEQFMQKWKPQK